MGCHELSYIARNAPPPSKICTAQGFAAPWWLWLLVTVQVIILIGIFYRMYLAYFHGMTFFNLPRRTMKYDVSKYASSLFEDAQHLGAELNPTYQRPSLNDL